MIYLSPRKDLNWEDDSSFSVVPHYRDSALIIGTLEAKTIARYPQLAIGDTILAFNGQSTYPLGPLEFCQTLDTYRESQRLEIKVKSKGQFIFNRALRYRPQKQKVALKSSR